MLVSVQKLLNSQVNSSIGRKKAWESLGLCLVWAEVRDNVPVSGRGESKCQWLSHLRYLVLQPCFCR